MKRLKIYFFILLFIFISSYKALCQEDTAVIEFIETTDVHGSLFPYDFIRDKSLDNSLAQEYTYIKKERSKNQEVVLLDDGDILQGQPVVYYSNYLKADTQHICASVMNYMAYDAATVGNHDIEAGHAVYDKLNGEFQFPWLSANTLKKGTDQPYFKPYAILKKKGIKIAVLGLTTPGIPRWLPYKLWEGMEFDDMIVSARHWVKYIREKEKPDLLIGLFHSGTDYTFGNQTDTTYKNENASKLVARKVEGFDLIFTGHDHLLTNDSVINSDGRTVYLLGGLSSAKSMGVATFYVSKENKKRIVREIVEAKNFPADSGYMEKFKNNIEAVKSFVGKPLGTLQCAISTRNALFYDTPFVDLIHTIQLDYTKADISFASPLGFDVTIKAGNVCVRDMFNLYRYENFLYTMKLSGKEIRNYLEFSYGLWLNTMKDTADHLILLNGSRTKYPYYHFDSAEGINYTVDVTKPVGKRINITMMTNGKPFEENKTYIVAMNSYRGSGGGGHLTDGAMIKKSELESRIISTTEKDFRYYIIKWIEEKRNIIPMTDNNWKIIPKNFLENGKAKDFDILYKAKE